MLNKMVPVKNVLNLSAAGEALISRAPGMPGMGVVHGATGYGKSTATAWYQARVNGVFVRALAVMTPSSLCETILLKLGREPRGSCARMMTDIIEALALSNRPLFIDEADYLANSKVMTESLRDLHDMATVPVVLIGMHGIVEKLKERKQLTGRIMADVQFNPLDIEDAREVATKLCEVKVADDLVERIHSKTSGAIRNIVVSLATVERRAKARGMNEIRAVDFARDEKFFTGDAPAPAAGGGKVTAIGAQR